METLVGHSKLKIEHRQKQEVKQEYKFIGSVKKKSGQFLFALNIDNNYVYKIKVESKQAFDVSKKQEIGIYKATINPNHPFLYAINLSNATRKFKKLYTDFDYEKLK